MGGKLYGTVQCTVYNEQGQNSFCRVCSGVTVPAYFLVTSPCGCVQRYKTKKRCTVAFLSLCSHRQAPPIAETSQTNVRFPFHALSIDAHQVIHFNKISQKRSNHADESITTEKSYGSWKMLVPRGIRGSRQGMEDSLGPYSHLARAKHKKICGRFISKFRRVRAQE